MTTQRRSSPMQTNPKENSQNETSHHSKFAIPTPFGKIQIDVTDGAMMHLAHLLIVLIVIGAIPCMFYFGLFPPR